MKKLINFSVLIIIALVIFSSCKKHHDTGQPIALNAAFVQGKWKITHYDDKGVDETNHFAGYEFQFNSNGIVTAAKTGSATVSGAWGSGNDNSTLKLVLDFGNTATFSELNEDWHVLQQSNVIIVLEHISGGNGGTAHLTFEKI